MDKLSSLFNNSFKNFNSKGNDSKQKEPILNETLTIEYFKQQDLDRSNFSYDLLVDIGLWSDDILLFLEVLRLAYSDFISSYSLHAEIFDEPIRTLIWFMNQKNYNKLPWVSKYLRNGRYDIPDNYLNAMIAEDNCYMRELEDRTRSENEKKHYYLFKAIQDIITLKQDLPIEVGDIKLSKEYEDKLRLYICVYSFKITYCVVDDTCRAILSSSLTGDKKGINMGEFIGDMIQDIDERVLPHLKIINDRKMYNKFYTFRDILSYMHCTSISFNHIFSSKKDPRISISNQTQDHHLRCDKIYDAETISRIESVFKYFLSILMDQHQKYKELEGHNVNIEAIINKEKLNLTSINVPVYNIIKTTDHTKIEKTFDSSPRTPKTPREDEDGKKITKSPRLRRLSISFTTPQKIEDAEGFVIDLSKKTLKTSTHKKYTTDLITLTPRKE